MYLCITSGLCMNYDNSDSNTLPTRTRLVRLTFKTVNRMSKSTAHHGSYVPFVQLQLRWTNTGSVLPSTAQAAMCGCLKYVYVELCIAGLRRAIFPENYKWNNYKVYKLLAVIINK